MSSTFDYSEVVYQELLNLVRDCSLIGISTFTNYYYHAVKVTKRLKAEYPEKKIVWGGVHATVSPETSIRYADMVCLGEGEETVLEIANRISLNMSVEDVIGTWTKSGDGSINKNPIRPLEENLDKYPYQDYDFSTMYTIYEDGHLRALTLEKMKSPFWMGIDDEYFGLKSTENYQYLTLGARGCPYECTYCCNNCYRRLYEGKGRLLRWRSVEHIIKELETVIKQYPFVNFISFFEDDFLARPIASINEFCHSYRSRIGLPFKCNFHAYGVTEEKISLLSDAGLICVEMGLESGSARTNREVFKRRYDPLRFMEATEILAKFPNIKTFYDIILDNPFETEGDMRETLMLMTKLAKPYNVSAFSLTFFPGTELYYRAIDERIITGDLEEIANKKNNKRYNNRRYIKQLFLSANLVDTRLGRALFSLASNPTLMRMLGSERLDNIMNPVMDILHKPARLLYKASRTLLKGQNKATL